MQAERAPVLGIALAMIVLVIECLGLVAYGEQRQPTRCTAQAPDAPIGTIVLEDIRLVPQEVDYCGTRARLHELDGLAVSHADKLCVTRGRR